MKGHKAACHGAQILPASSLAPGCHPYICFWLLVEPLLDVWAVFALEHFSLSFAFFFPEVKKTPQARVTTLNPFLTGRQLLFLQHGPEVTWPTMVWIQLFGRAMPFVVFAFLHTLWVVTSSLPSHRHSPKQCYPDWCGPQNLLECLMSPD